MIAILTFPKPRRTSLPRRALFTLCRAPRLPRGLFGGFLKRFTDTEKWSDPWVRKLPLRLKLFWFYLCDKCDAAGVWKLDFEAASFHIGEQVQEQEAKSALGHRIEVLPGDRWLVKKFIPFQYGTLSDKCRPHMNVITLCHAYGISLKDGVYTLPDRVSDTLQEQDKTGQEEDKTGSEGGLGGTYLPGTTKANNGNSNGARDLQLKLNAMFGRDDSVWDPEDERALIAVAQRPNWPAEFTKLEKFKERDLEYFPQSVGTLLAKWANTLDRAGRPPNLRQNRDQYQPPANPNPDGFTKYDVWEFGTEKYKRWNRWMEKEVG